MNEVETALKDMIMERYGSLKKFCVIINMPWTTLDSILKRGVSNSNISNVLKITKELGISAEKLADGEIVKNASFISDDNSMHSTIAAHKDGENFTPEELNKIEEYKRLLLAARPRNNGDD